MKHYYKSFGFLKQVNALQGSVNYGNHPFHFKRGVNDDCAPSPNRDMVDRENAKRARVQNPNMKMNLHNNYDIDNSKWQEGLRPKELNP